MPTVPRRPILFRFASLWIGCLLIAATVFVYWPVRHHDFVEYDDGPYVKSNPKVQAGLTVDGVRWAFQTTHGGNWHPVTWLSHMLDCEWFGVSAGEHHLTNLFFHVCNALLLFGVLRCMTGTVWRSGLVAALFALHPLHVESVAWVAERKDVLSTCFFLLTVWAYAVFVERSKVQSPKSKVFYGLSLVFFALGLMSKPMLVTVPFVFLLLDYWPLGRIRFEGTDKRGRSLLPLFQEKLPYFLLSGLCCCVALWSQHRAGAVSSFDAVPLGPRLANAVVAYGRYLGKTFWPDNLAVFYPPPPDGWSFGQVVVVGALILLITALAILRARKEPCFVTGWFWYLGTLVPVIGLVQVGEQSLADRYSYIPLIGIFVCLAWGLAILANHPRVGRTAVVAATVGALAMSAVLARFQVGRWRNTDTLFSHAAKVTVNNHVAYGNLGLYFADEGNLKVGGALSHAALRIAPRSGQVQNNLGLLLEKQGWLAEAAGHYLAAQRAHPGLAESYNNLGAVYIKQGRLTDALDQLREALRLQPDSADIRYNLGLALSLNDQPEEARVQLETALRLRPDFAKAHYQLGIVMAKLRDTAAAQEHLHRALALGFDPANVHEQLGNVFFRRGDPAAAAKHYREALKLQPRHLGSLNNLAWILATDMDDRLRNGSEAVELAKRAMALSAQPQPEALDTLAAAYAETGDFPAAIATTERAIALARANGPAGLVPQLEVRLRLYRSGLPFHEDRGGRP